jgi:hypothetical protein
MNTMPILWTLATSKDDNNSKANGQSALSALAMEEASNRQM